MKQTLLLMLLFVGTGLTASQSPATPPVAAATVTCKQCAWDGFLKTCEYILECKQLASRAILTQHVIPALVQHGLLDFKVVSNARTCGWDDNHIHLLIKSGWQREKLGVIPEALQLVSSCWWARHHGKQKCEKPQ